MAIGVTSVEQHSIGDLKFHTAVVTNNTTGANALAGATIGLQNVKGVVVLAHSTNVGGAAYAAGTLTLYDWAGSVQSGACTVTLGFIGW